MRIPSYPSALFRQVIATATSREKLRQHFKTSLYSNAYYLMATQGIASVLGFAFWVVAARFYSTEAVGLAGAIIPAIALLSALSELGLGYGLIRFLPGAGDKTNQIMSSSLTLCLLASLAASLVFLFGLDLWSPALLVLRSRPVYFAAFVLFTLAFTFRALAGSIFIAHLRAKFVFVTTLVVRSAALPLLLLFTVFFSGFISIVAALGIATMISLGIVVFVLLPRTRKGYFPRPQISKQVIKEIIPYSIGNHIGLVLGALITWLLPLIVVNAIDAEANAYFYVCWAIALAIGVIPTGLATSAFAESSHREEDLLLNIRRALRLSFLLQIPIIALILGIGDKLLLLYGAEYSEAGATTLRLLALSALPGTVCGLYIVYARVRKRLAAIIGLQAVTSGAVLLLTHFLISEHGIEGVAIAYLAGLTLVALGIMAWAIYKVPRKQWRLILKGR